MISIHASTRLAVVLGDPVEHSLSPALHNAAFEALGIDAVYLAWRVAAPRLPAVLDALVAVSALGASVTVPHKQAVLDRCDHLSDDAARIGAVNCLEVSGDRLIGHNTDAGGFTDALLEHHGERADAWRPLLLGAGGAARAVAVGLYRLGAEVEVVARSPEAVDWIDAKPWTSEVLAGLLPQSNLLVDCTSAALSPESERRLPAPIELTRLGGDSVVCSLVYHREPRLLAEARALGIEALDGAGMLVHQARRALEIWTGVAVPAAILWRALGREPPAPGGGDDHSPPTAR